MFVPRTLHHFGELVMLFNEMKVPIRVDSDQQVIESGPLRLHWHTSHPFLHVTHLIQSGVPADRAAAVEHAIVEHNHAAQLPVLDFDARTGTILFRVTIPVLVDGVRRDLLQAILSGIDVRASELCSRLASLVGTVH